MSFRNPDRLKKNSAKKVTKKAKIADKTIVVKKINGKPKKRDCHSTKKV